MVKITNTAEGARGVHTDEGIVFIEGKQSREIELSEFGRKNMPLYPELVEGDLSDEDKAKYGIFTQEDVDYQSDTSMTQTPTGFQPQSPSVKDATGELDNKQDLAPLSEPQTSPIVPGTTDLEGNGTPPENGPASASAKIQANQETASSEALKEATGGDKPADTNKGTKK